MIFASPVSANYVDGSFYEDAGRPFYLSPEKLEGDYSPVRFSRELRLFRSFCTSGKVLDVGCSTGAFLYQLNKSFPGEYQIFGTDVSGPALDYAEDKGAKTIRADFLSANFSEDNFDAVTLWAVLEHVSEPRLFIEQAARVLRPGGVCLMLVPNWNSLARRFLNRRYRYILAQHLNYFTPHTLRKLVSPHFQVIETAFTHFNPIVILKDFLKTAEPSAVDRAKLLQKTNQLKQKRGSLLHSAYGWAESTLAMARLTDNISLIVKKKD